MMENEMAKPKTPNAMFLNGVSKVREHKASIAKRIKKMHEHKHVYIAILNCFGDDLKDVAFSDDNIYCLMTEMSGFKDPKLTSIFSKLMDIDGITAGRTSEYANSLNRDYVFEYKYGEHWNERIRIVISVYISSNSPTCRKELVSTEYQKVEKYTLICD
jgi:hypothetical protein